MVRYSSLLTTLGLDGISDGWGVRPLLVLEAELLTPFVTQVAVPVIPLHDLEEVLQRGDWPPVQ